jgi:hypothetical protein
MKYVIPTGAANNLIVRCAAEGSLYRLYLCGSLNNTP